MLRLIVLLVVVDLCGAAKLADKGVQIMLQAVASSRQGGAVRQCSCAEMQSCIAQDMATMDACSRQCYGSFSSVTRTPYALQSCLDQGTANQVTSCVTGQLFSCGRGATATRYNYAAFYSSVILQVQSRKNELTGTSPLRLIKPVANAGLDFGVCALNCFLRANPNRCFDSRQCQPQVNESAIRHAAKYCFKQIETAAKSKCFCMLNAGVSSLQNYCALARTMG